MFLYRSNQSERLVGALAKVLEQPLSDPLSTEVIVVQSRGMERWLAMELSARLGVFANARFPFPRHVIDSIYEAAAQDTLKPGAFDEHTLLWAIAGALPSLLGQPAFAPLAGYLQGDADGSRRLQLAERLARVFDDYGVYRPELLLGWERGQEDGWEARLWRALVQHHGGDHQAGRAKRCIEALRERRVDREKLPERLCIFGIATLPPLYLQVLSALSEVVPTHLFLLSPCKEYFGDLRRKEGTGHPLLASLGRIGSELQEILLNLGVEPSGEQELYVEPGRDSLLHAVQSDLLALHDRRADPNDDGCRVAAGDASITVHVCHSVMREVEVLHDQLVNMLEDTTLEPHEIVVMTPDVDRYAPAVEAVFSPESGRPVVPYSLADRRARSDHAFLDGVFMLLESLSGRMSASAVLDLAGIESVRRRFGIEIEELERLRRWVEDSGIRWGADERHRAEEGQPAARNNTWAFGLERMLLGYAMEGEERVLFEEVLPYDGIEGADAQLLGKLAELCAKLFHHMRALREPRPLAQWRDDLGRLLSDLLDPGPLAAHQLSLVSNALAELAQRSEQAGFRDAVDRKSVCGSLERAVDERSGARGLLQSGVTFCQLVPMRSIPFKVVCLVGMNDDVFPGRSTVLGFDRMALDHKPGDRNRRDDDRYMFLEALLGARERLLLSYVGRSVHDNRVIPPSVVVQELLDTIDRGFLPWPEPAVEPDEARKGPKLSEQITVVHRLHAFSPRYFETAAGRLFSYSRGHCRAATELTKQEREHAVFAHEPLSAAELPSELTLDELTLWLTRPLETFMRRTLGVHLGRDLAPLPDREPLRLDNLEQWKLGTDALELLFAGVSEETARTLAEARGALPAGALGELACLQVMPGVRAIHELARGLRQGDPRPPLPIDITVDGLRITGSIAGLWPRAHLRTSYSRLGRRYELEHFIRHVVLGYELERRPRPGYPTTSVIVARPQEGEGAERLTFRPLDNAEWALRELLRLLRRAQREPLPFYYEVSRAYAECFRRVESKAEDAARGAADRISKWGLDPYVQLAFGDYDAMIDRVGAEGFDGTARDVFRQFFHATEAS